MIEKVLITVELTVHHADALAQFVKRLGWSEMRGNASSEGEAYLIREAVDQIGRELADAGHAPR